MIRTLVTLALCLVCSIVGLCVGIAFAPQLRTTGVGLFFQALVHRVPSLKAGTGEQESAIEMYDFPTIKWRAKPLAAPVGAIGQLWTNFECTDEQHQTGTLNYRLTLFKATDNRQCKIQLLDENGFKLMQFDVSDFHQVPGAADVTESRDSTTCDEDKYKRAADYVIISGE